MSSASPTASEPIMAATGHDRVEGSEGNREVPL
jgi:hypothetical protein